MGSDGACRGYQGGGREKMCIRDRNMGYIEVQQSADKVHEKLRMADKDLKVCLVNEEGELLYWNTQVDMGFCRSLLGRGKIPAGRYAGEEGTDYLAAGVYNEEAGTMVLVYKDSSLIQGDMVHIMYMTIFLVGCMLLFSLLYVAVSTSHLTKSIIQLQNVLANTNLETLDQMEPLEFRNENDEFQRIGQVYDCLLYTSRRSDQGHAGAEKGHGCDSGASPCKIGTGGRIFQKAA